MATGGAPVVEATEGELAWMTISRLEGGLVTPGVGRGGVQFRVAFDLPMEVFGGYDVYVEPLARGFDALAIGSVGVAWRFMDEDAYNLRIGGTVRHFQDGEGPRFGFQVMGGFDVFLLPFCVLSFEAAGGLLGDAWTGDVRGTIGLVLGPVEIYLGYHHLELTAINGSGSAPLTGPVAGLRLWI